MATAAQGRDPFQLCGTTIEGKYRVASVVGDGGFGVVYRGVHIGFGELIAVKCLKLGGDLDEAQRTQLLEQLRDEGRLLHRLSRATSGIVQALDVGAFTTPSGAWVPYLVLEWLEGQTLGEFMRARSDAGEGGLPLRDAMALLEPAARALAVAHAQKVAHRDVKPANLFVTEVAGVRTVKVLDFGIAKVLTSHPTVTAAMEATKMGPTAFTPRYGAPEQFNKQRGASGPWTDVFALALILVELVSGQRALDGDDPTQLYIAAADPMLRPTLRARGVEATAAVEKVLDRALAIEPKHRYSDAGEFWDALTVAVAAGGGDARGDGADTEALPASQNLLGTAEFAERRQLDLSDAGAGAPAHKRVALAPTVPAESPGAKRGASGPKADEAPTQASTGVVGREVGGDGGSGADSMVETPVAERSASSPRLGSGSGSGEIAVANELPGAPAAQRAPARGRPLWPWLVGVALVGSAAVVYVYSYLGPPIGAHPSASARSSSTASTTVRPRPSPSGSASAPVASASAPVASASAPVASASAMAPPAPASPEGMAYVAPGKLALGEPGAARETTVTKGFFLDKTEVTVRDYRVCLQKHACSPADHVDLPKQADVDGGGPDEFSDAWSRRCNEPRGALDQPVNCVDFGSAEAFCRFRDKRLPTEAEWELAARGPAGRPFPWGDEPASCVRACYARNSDCRIVGDEVATCAAGLLKGDATPEGVLDLAGNVSEWVADGYASPPPGGVDPKGATSLPLRVVRGASFLDEYARLRATMRSGFGPGTAHVTIGFRCARDAPSP